MPNTNPLKMHGGKSYLADWIISHMQPHIHYVEPFFGGGAVLFRKDPEGVSEVVSDLNDELSNFWKILQDEYSFSEFVRRVQLTPFSKDEFEACRDSGHKGSPTERAVAFFVHCRQSRQGLGKDFATLSRNRTRCGKNEQVSSWLAAVAGLPAAHERLKRVVILNDDALNVIRQQDGPNTLFYLDPPYLHETRHGNSANHEYKHEMTDDEHRLLLETLSGITGKFLLSGYHSQLYDSFGKQCGWTCHEKKIDLKSSSQKTKVIKTECLWCNFRAESSCDIVSQLPPPARQDFLLGMTAEQN